MKKSDLENILRFSTRAVGILERLNPPQESRDTANLPTPEWVKENYTWKRLMMIRNCGRLTAKEICEWAKIPVARQDCPYCGKPL